MTFNKDLDSILFSLLALIQDPLQTSSKPVLKASALYAAKKPLCTLDDDIDWEENQKEKETSTAEYHMYHERSSWTIYSNALILLFSYCFRVVFHDTTSNWSGLYSIHSYVNLDLEPNSNLEARILADLLILVVNVVNQVWIVQHLHSHLKEKEWLLWTNNNSVSMTRIGQCSMGPYPTKKIHTATCSCTYVYVYVAAQLVRIHIDTWDVPCRVDAMHRDGHGPIPGSHGTVDRRIDGYPKPSKA